MAVPPHDRVGRHDCRYAAEEPAPQQLALRRKAASLIVREPEPSTAELLLEDAVLLDQVLDRALLLTAAPADGGQENGAER